MPPLNTIIHLKKARTSKPKIFQCTGFGRCEMIFTRSEHLARHTRKHTGEKPFLCVVPGCTRKFSRFDNMMQHTQTHDKQTRSQSSSLSPTLSPSSICELEFSHHLSRQQQQKQKQQSNQSKGGDSSDEEITCLPPTQQEPPLLKELHLTQDEFEALQGFGRFQRTPVIMDSFRDLASVVHIEPNPERQNCM